MANVRGCFDDLEVLQFVDGSGDAAQRRELIGHVEECEACRRLVEGLLASQTVPARPAAATARAKPGVPEQVAGFRFGSLIAEGGMGRIYRATDTTLGREVAIKIPRDSGSRLLRRFEREVSITAGLQHPGIVPIHGAGELPGGLPFYVMRFVEGTTLDRAVAEVIGAAGRLALMPRMLAVVETMAYVHEQRILHRDLKPNNVLLGKFGETVIIDWGLAKRLERERAEAPMSRASAEHLGGNAAAAPADADEDADARSDEYTREGEIIGTPAFMAPEQAAGQPVDVRADVYALGAMLRFVATGRLLPGAAELSEVPAALQAVWERAMAFEPGARYPSASELATELRVALAEPVPSPAPVAEPVIAVATLPPSSPRRSWRMALVVAFAVLGVGVVVLAMRGAKTSATAPGLVVRSAQPYGTMAMAVSPSGDRVASAAVDRLDIVDVRTGKTWTRPGWMQVLGAVRWESDDVVTYVAQSNDWVGQRMRWMLSTNTASPVGATFDAAWTWRGATAHGDLVVSPDGRTLALDGADGRRVIPTSSIRPILMVSIAPDGRRFAFVEPRGAAAGVIRIFDGDRHIATSPILEEITALTWRDDTAVLYALHVGSRSAITSSSASEAGLAAPHVVFEYQSDDGWIGQLAARGTRLFASRVSSSFESRVHDRESRIDVALGRDGTRVPVGWRDAQSYEAWNPATRRFERFASGDAPTPSRLAGTVEAEPANATRADDIVILATRIDAGRTVEAHDANGMRWRAPNGALAFVRCAGDAAAPCVAGVVVDGGGVEVHRIDPRTGTVGQLVLPAADIVDAALDASGQHLAWVEGRQRVFTRPLAGGATEDLVAPTGSKLAGVHSIAADPRGGWLVSSVWLASREIIQLRSGQATSVVRPDHVNVLTLIRPSPDGGRLTYRVRRLQSELVEVPTP